MVYVKKAVKVVTKQKNKHFVEGKILLPQSGNKVVTKPQMLPLFLNY